MLWTRLVDPRSELPVAGCERDHVLSGALAVRSFTLWALSMSLASQRLHSRRGQSAICQIVGNLVVGPHEGSIDSLFPEGSPLRGFFDVALLQRAPFPPKQCGTKLSSLPSPCSLS